MLNSVIAQPTTTASSSQFTPAKESSIMLLLNNVKRYLPHVSIVVGYYKGASWAKKGTGENPTDRAKYGNKRSIVIDGKGVRLGMSSCCQ